MIYLLWGPDEFGIQIALNNLKGDDPIITLNEPSLEELRNCALTDSFFDNKKTILLNFYLPKVAKEKKEAQLKNILSKISADTTIIFVEKDLPKGNLKAYFSDTAKTQSFMKPTGKDLAGYIKKRAQELGTEISPLAAERFGTYVGPNYWQIEEELKKLALYVKGRELEPGIDINDVDELVHSGFEANIFELMDAISQKNINRAVTLLDSFLDSGENELYILTMIARQFRNIAMAKIDNIQNEGTLAKRAGIHPFVAKKTIQQARNFSIAEVDKIFGKITKADLELKSGQNAKQALQAIILN